MDYRKRDNGLLTFVEHWNIVIVAVVAVIACKVLDFFMRLSGAPRAQTFPHRITAVTARGGSARSRISNPHRGARFDENTRFNVAPINSKLN